jgi:hypothetical protein
VLVVVSRTSNTISNTQIAEGLKVTFSSCVFFALFNLYRASINPIASIVFLLKTPTLILLA